AEPLPTANDVGPDDWQSDFGFEDSVSQAASEDAASVRLASVSNRKRSRPRDEARAAAASSTSGFGAPRRSGGVAVADGACREEAGARRQQLLAMDAYSRHKMLVNNYIRYFGGSYADFKRDASRDKRDIDIIREHHRFVWDGGSEEAGSWEQRLAKRYWDKLYKEYCIADLRGYKEGRVGLRWRTEAEVLSGRGQFACGGKRCEQADGLVSWEVNFRYTEGGETKNALVKLRLCPDCSARLNYKKKHRRREAKRQRLSESATQPLQPKAEADAAADTEAEDEVLAGIRAIRQAAEQQQAAAEPPGDAVAADASEIWRQPAPAVEDEGASREEEFDQYFADMLL
ncbi:hypothetical protein BOX15_Mlig005215g3, partial [Macrostomum lignano]